jgi:hypothetical protein
MAIVFGASSPKTTCMNEIKAKAMVMETAWVIPSGAPTASTSGSMSTATAGSPNHPNPSEEMVMPSWHTAR